MAYCDRGEGLAVLVGILPRWWRTDGRWRLLCGVGSGALCSFGVFLRYIPGLFSVSCTPLLLRRVLMVVFFMVFSFFSFLTWSPDWYHEVLLYHIMHIYVPVFCFVLFSSRDYLSLFIASSLLCVSCFHSCSLYRYQFFRHHERWHLILWIW